jgi:hypothetical protein
MTLERKSSRSVRDRRSTKKPRGTSFEIATRPIDEVTREFADRGKQTWRQDGKERYDLTPDWEAMAVDVTTTPTFQAGTPRLLFKLPGPLLGNPWQWKNVSRDGQRFVFAINVPASVTAR